MSGEHAALLERIRVFFASESDSIARMAIAASRLYHFWEQANWCGFYRKDPLCADVLVLGPFMGKPARSRFTFAEGICGRAARSKQTQKVDDTHADPDHYACDAATCSELVVPVFDPDGILLGVLDCDSDRRAGFDSSDVALAESVAGLFEVLKEDG